VLIAFEVLRLLVRFLGLSLYNPYVCGGGGVSVLDNKPPSNAPCVFMLLI